MRSLLALCCLLLFLCSCEKKNPNYEPPAPYDAKPVGHHKFDGGESAASHEKGGEGGGEKAEKSE